jgi:uncharacterized protein (TIGR02996 family)
VSDGEALLRAVLDEPADDAHRLVYADWCEDNGDTDRAEFVRVQLMIAGRLDRRGAGIGTLLRRERELWWQNAARWTGRPLGILQAVSQWRGGFLHTAHSPLQTWLDHGAAVTRLHPVGRVRASDARPWRDSGASRPDRGVWWNAAEWHAGDGRADCVLPPALFGLIAAAWPVAACTDGEGTVLMFDTVDLSNAALSDALLEYARRPL